MERAKGSSGGQGEGIPRLDLRGTRCPLNYVKTKLRLEEMTSGDVLEILLDAGEAMSSVPRSVRDEGHVVREQESHPTWGRLLIEKGDAAPGRDRRSA